MDKILKKKADAEGEGDEDAHRKHDGKRHRKPHEKLFRVSFCHPVKHLVRLRLLRFLILVKFCGPGQCPHAEHHGIYKIKNAPDKRKLYELFAAPDALIFFLLRLDHTVRPAHGYGVFLFVFHHNAFQNRLSADPGIMSAFFRARFTH